MRLTRRRFGAALLLGAAATRARASAARPVVFAAASLKTALDAIARDYAERSGARPVLSYAGSSVLARQIIHGAPADVFISASPQWMDAVAEAGGVEPMTRVDLLTNRLALISRDPDAAPRAVTPELDLAALLQGGKLAMALVDAVPAGQYGKQALQTLGLWESVAPHVAQTDNVRAALRLVAAGEAPLGVVYASDALAEPGVSVLGLFPEAAHAPIISPAAALRGSEAGAAFLAHLRDAAAGALFRRWGFGVIAQ
jgi:molybdate transport system substrate-binding protein